MFYDFLFALIVVEVTFLPRSRKRRSGINHVLPPAQCVRNSCRWTPGRVRWHSCLQITLCGAAGLAQGETWRHEVILWRAVRSPDRSAQSLSEALWPCPPGLRSLCCCSQGPESPPGWTSIKYLPFYFLLLLFRVLRCLRLWQVPRAGEREENAAPQSSGACILHPRQLFVLMILHLSSPFYCLRLKLFSLFSSHPL